LRYAEAEELVAFAVFTGAGLEEPAEVFSLIVVFKLAESLLGFGGGGHVLKFIGA
jgi:hypothetical protein